MLHNRFFFIRNKFKFSWPKIIFFKKSCCMAFTERIRCNKKSSRDKRDRRNLSYKFHGSFFYIFHLQVIHERPWEKLFHKYKACIVSNFRILFFFLDR